ncbi:Uncharacterised protein [Fusobacterium polymorphum]|uniref:Uncharacterized protein n=1 Tax=Fusobacterium polymorphum ATCC 10953 TaxID=393480 RepID=A5TVF4_FUSNP|nr:hypothetical protein [Fusobacterium polymorphum]EDK88879.1 hypothetical protein FNP_1089 [Fusobacterium polymorphum ATCC 10953]UTI53409.1 hypothetical protein NLJ26_01980 [Fusobacterium polymorphum]WRL67931.1 hypothetical protein VKN78_09015 [Fusobacterium polymorphum]CKG70188.1 Uncharacterised protein [Fusobacterium polymorphum]
MKFNKFCKILEPYFIGFFITFMTLTLINICVDLKENLGNFIFTAGIAFSTTFFATYLSTFVNKYRGNSNIYLSKFTESFIRRENFILRNQNFSVKDKIFLELNDEVLLNHKVLSIYFLNKEQLGKLEVFAKDYRTKTSEELIMFIKEEISI